MLWVCTFKGFKMFGKWGYLIKRLSGQQGVKGQVVQVEWWEHLGKCL